MLSIQEIYRQNQSVASNWRKKSRTSGGKLKRNLFYGTKLGEPLRRGEAIIWLGASYTLDDGYDKALIEDVVSSLDGTGQIYIYSVDSEVAAKLIADFPKQTVDTERVALELLATCETVVSVSLLPTLYRMREGQHHIHILTAADLSLNRYARSRGMAACLFSADWIVTQSKEDLAQVVEAYWLDGMYQGNLVPLQLGKTVGSTIADILAGRTDNFSSVSCKQSNNRLLIFCDCCPHNSSSDYCLHLVNLIDLETTDVTVVIQSYNDEEFAYELVDSLDERVRILSRIGSFSCDEESYLAVQVINEIILDHENPLELFEILPKQTLQDEVSRMLPNMQFNSFVYCARDRKLWTLISSAITATRKTMLQLEYFSCMPPASGNEERVLRFTNKSAIIDTVFDAVGFANSEMQAGLAPFLPSCRTWAWSIDMPLLPSSSDTDLQPIPVSIAGSSYSMLQPICRGHETSGRGLQSLIYLPLPTGYQHMLTFARMDDVSSLSQLTKNLEDDIYLCLITENRASSSPTLQFPPESEHLVTMDLASLVNSPFAASFLQQFDAYMDLSDATSESNAVKSLSLSIGLPIYLFDSATKEVISIPEAPGVNYSKEVAQLVL